MNLSGKVFVVTGALGDLGQAVTACLIAHGAKLALLGNRARPGFKHPAGALPYCPVFSIRRSTFNRWVSPMAVAEAIAFLISDQARDISGVSLPVAGRE
jgi:NAD(P)-dependent dehydrogenase (short-subunit alcohol dehydrogenase family)